MPKRGTIEERSAKLNDEIARFLPQGSAIHLVGHSMGGLDARCAIQRYGLGERVLNSLDRRFPR